MKFIAFRSRNNAARVMQILKEIKVCKRRVPGVVVFSTGIWEAAHAFNNVDIPHDTSSPLDDAYTVYISSIFAAVLKECAERVILVTEPLSHSPTAMRWTPCKDYTAAKVLRLYRLNHGLRRAATKHRVRLIDNGLLTESRVDGMKDTTHYVCGDCNHKVCMRTGGMGSAIMHVGTQMLVRGIIHMFGGSVS